MVTQETGALRKQATPIARALNTIGTVTKRPYTMQTQGGRFRIQKTVYLLKHAKYPPAQRFAFNLYHMGPYSPDLATAYYELEDEGIRAAGAATDIPARTLSMLVDATVRPQEFLEGLTTLLDVWSQTRNLVTALSQAKSVKRHIDEPAWKEVRAFLQAHPTLIAAT